MRARNRVFATRGDAISQEENPHQTWAWGVYVELNLGRARPRRAQAGARAPDRGDQSQLAAERRERGLGVHKELRPTGGGQGVTGSVGKAELIP